MRSKIIFTLLLAVQFVCAQQPNEWENPNIVDKNKVEGRATFVLFQNESIAKNNKAETSAYYKSFG